MRKQAAMPTVEIRHAGDGRTDHPGDVECARTQRDRVQQVFPRHDVGDQRLPGRHLERAQDAEENGEANDPVDGDEVEKR